MRVGQWDGRIRVLHVDDDPAFGALVSEFLRREDEAFEVTTATSADEGLARLEEGTFECVVSDYQMPGADGLAFLRTVRGTYPRLPFVLFTGRGSEEIASEAISAGVTDYLQKGGPERYTVLANRVENAVDRYTTRRELDRTREWFRTLIENSTDLTTVVDESCVIVYQSPAVERRFGYGPDELVGTDGLAHVHPDDRERVRRAFEAFVDAPEGGLEDLVYRFRGADGSWHWLDSWVSEARDTIVDGFVVNSRDVTDLHDQRERFRTLVEEARDTIFVVDTDGNIDYATPGVEELLGFRPAELVGRNGFDRIHPDDVAAATAEFARAVTETAGRGDTTFRYRHADGSWVGLDGRVRNRLDDPVVDGLIVYVNEETGPMPREEGPGPRETGDEAGAGPTSGQPRA
jgi:PAS domain S-box-containing protein